MVEAAAALVGAIVGWLLGIFSDGLKAMFFGPKLRFALNPDNQVDMHATTFEAPSAYGPRNRPIFYVRLRIQNTGHGVAEDVEVILKSLAKRQTGGFKLDPEFLPLNLKWSYTGQTYYPLIPPRVERHLDLFAIRKPEAFRDKELAYRKQPEKTTGAKNPWNLIEFSTAVEPNTGTDLQLPGEYEIELIAAARNAKPIAITVHLTVKNEWHDGAAMAAQVSISGISRGKAL